MATSNGRAVLNIDELRFRRAYIQARLAELKAERERLVVERDHIVRELSGRGLSVGRAVWATNQSTMGARALTLDGEPVGLADEDDD